MDILLINPCLRPNNPRKFFPIGLGYIATVMKIAGYDFTIYDLDAHRPTDGQFQAFLASRRFDVVAFGALVTHYRWVKWALSVIREAQRRATIILGNSVATSIPEQLLRWTEADVAVVGEGEVTILEVLDRLRKSESLEGVDGVYFKQDGRIVANAPRAPIPQIDTLPFVNRDLFDIEAYLEASKFNVNEPYPRPLDQIVTQNLSSARGCIYKCTFCFHNFLGKGYRYRSEESVVAEIRQLQQRYGVNYIQFWNDLTFCNKSHVERFVDRLLAERLNVNWMASVVGTLFQRPGPRDEAIALKMKQSGCVGVTYSLESANQEIMKAVNKPMSLTGYSNTRCTLKAAGVPTLTSVIFGYPQETPASIQETIDFCIKEGVAPSAGYLLPTPGTPVYRDAMARGLIQDEEQFLMNLGDRQNLHLNLTSMSDEELQRQVREGMIRCQKAVLGEYVHYDDPLKTLRKRSGERIDAAPETDRSHTG